MATNGNYIQNQFCSYEIALALKELGFDEPCIARFNSDGNLIILRQTATSVMSLVSTIKNSEDITLFIGDVVTPICAPLWQQVIDWFREKHQIYIRSRIDVGNDPKYQIHKLFNKSKPFEVYMVYGDDYYKAREAAILEAIKIVKGEKK